ncbi:MAG TPA: HEAT repeat domain-containing protein [Candidatus Sulfotelmatobacter sp.]|nr:HEAT repeat domain-containing protein [Candidatus Sulfotelmatobacter sp.]
MPGKRKFEEQLAALDALRQLPPEACVEPLRKALTHRNNFVVAKAADLVRQFQLTQLIPDLLIALDRFFDDPVKSDPQCWAKNATSRALAAFEHQDAEVFLRGMRHHQHEPVWGGSSDTAGTLRATCALALVQCRSLTDADLLSHLVELLGDKDKAVRTEAVRAIEQVGSPSAALLLRLRAILGSGSASEEPEVLGACYGGILRLEGASAIPWVSRFLASSDDSAAEAALAIAGTHSPQGFELLRERFAREADPWFCSVLLSAIALTRQDAALEFMLDLIRKESLQAESAIEAILRSTQSPEVTKRLEELVAGNRRLSHALAKAKLNK